MSKGKIVSQTLSLCRKIEKEKISPAEINSIFSEIESDIRIHWNPDDWSEEACLNLSDRVIEQINDSTFSPIEALVLDLSYYSDRWCDWRVGVIRHRISKLLNT